MTRNNQKADGIHGGLNDEWLTPLDLIQALGPFSLDPCAAVKMPWKTARTMWSIKDNGLGKPWNGRRVFLNPPYSACLPWVQTFVRNGKGIALVSAKSTETRWGQLLLQGCHSCLWLKGRISFYYADGRQSAGAYLSSMLVAMTPEDTDSLHRLREAGKYDGVLFDRMLSLKEMATPPGASFGGDDDI